MFWSGVQCTDMVEVAKSLMDGIWTSAASSFLPSAFISEGDGSTTFIPATRSSRKEINHILSVYQHCRLLSEKPYLTPALNSTGTLPKGSGYDQLD